MDSLFRAQMLGCDAASGETMANQLAKIEDTGTANSRSARTQMLLMTSAEHIVAENGPGALTLRNVAAHAGQGNTNAAIYHFKTVDNLIWNVIEARARTMELERGRLLAAVKQQGRTDDLASLLACLINPIASITDDNGDHIFARFQLQLYINHHPYSYLLREVINPDFPARSELLELVSARIDPSFADFSRYLLPSLVLMPLNVIFEHDIARNNGLSPPPLETLCLRSYQMMAAAIEVGCSGDT